MPSALAQYAQRIEAPVLVQIADLERGDLRAPESDLQADGEDRAIAQSGDRVLRRCVEQFARLRFRKGEGRAFVAIDRRPFDLADRVARGLVVANQVLIERGQRRGAGGSSRPRRARSRA